MDFNNKLALITGGSSGIGLATACSLAALGSRVWILARNSSRLVQASELIKTASTHPNKLVGVLNADVSDDKIVGTKLSEFIANIGVPDILINSAGVAHPGLIERTDACIFEEMMAVNYLGTVYVTKAVIPDMIARGSGVIINVSSLAGFIGIIGYSAYGASKYAVRGFSDVIRAELKPKGINVSIVYPTDVDTPQLIYDNHFKPVETRALEEVVGVTKPMSAEVVAQAIIEGMVSKRYIIVPGIDGKILYTLINIVGSLIYPIMDMLITKSQKRVQKNFRLTSDI